MSPAIPRVGLARLFILLKKSLANFEKHLQVLFMWFQVQKLKADQLISIQICMVSVQTILCLFSTRLASQTDLQWSNKGNVISFLGVLPGGLLGNTQVEIQCIWLQIETNTSSYILVDWCIPVWHGLAGMRYVESLQNSTKSAAQQPSVYPCHTKPKEMTLNYSFSTLFASV